MKTHISKIRMLAALTLLCTTARLDAGPINPPVGPVAPTHKTLTEVEPRTAINATNTPGDADSLFKITQPGSYYLAGSIQGVAAKHGIEIVAGGVTLDLNGFDLLGIAGSLDGVSVTLVSLRNIAVVNGSVRNWGGDGVDLASFGAFNCRVADLLASGNTGNGISVAQGSTVSNCSAGANTGIGISTSSGCTVANCLASSNTGAGIGADLGCTVSNCSAYTNAGGGISVNSGCTVADCTARSNTLDGIICSGASMIRGNTCAFNGSGAGDGAGIHATGNDNRIEGNNCIGADRGIDVDALGNIIIKNTCSNATTNWDVVAGNALAPIVISTTNAAAVTGNTYAGSLGSTDPNANFTY